MEKVNAKKKFGQNFLKDNSVINKIVDSVSSNTNSLVIEIGPGMGALTNKLINKCNKFIAYEIDKDCVCYLKDKINDNRLNIIEEDFLKCDLSYLEKEKDVHLVSNIPYYITSPIISRFINEMKSVNEATFMVQKEVGERLLAKVNTKDYNAFTIMVQYYCDIKRIVNVSRACFNPSPNVDSVVIKLIRCDRKYKPIDEKLFNDLVVNSFRERRKTLVNNLSNFKSLSKDNICMLLEMLNKDLNVRAEALTIDEFISLSNLISEKKWEE